MSRVFLERVMQAQKNFTAKINGPYKRTHPKAHDKFIPKQQSSTDGLHDTLQLSTRDSLRVSYRD